MVSNRYGTHSSHKIQIMLKNKNQFYRKQKIKEEPSLDRIMIPKIQNNSERIIT